MSRARVVVVGSVNLDLVYRVPHLPRPGETLLGSDFVRLSGGKGGNQAHAAARLAGDSVDVSMRACVGTDPAADQLRQDLETAGVDIAGVLSVPGTSGTALIAVDEQGENTIVVIPGANGAWPADVVGGLDLRQGDIVVLQLEVPFEIVEAVVTRAAAAGARVVLNAAPLDRRASTLLDRVEVLVVNEVEASELFGFDADLDRDAVGHLATETSTDLVVTLGARGVVIGHGVGSPAAEAQSFPAYPVDAIDTVGAGDAFVGGLAVALASGASIDVAARWGSAAGALTTTVVGARHEGLDRGAVEALAGPLGVPPGLSSPARGTD